MKSLSSVVCLLSSRRGGTPRPTIARRGRSPRPTIARAASLVSCLATFLIFSLSARAELVKAASTIGGDSTGLATRKAIAAAIADADTLAADLAPSDAASRKDSWTRIYGTAAAANALKAVEEVREALTALRDNWDALSVQTLSIKTGWNSFYVYVDDPAPATAVLRPTAYAERLRSRVAAGFANPAEEAPAEILLRLKALAASYVTIRQTIIAAFSTKAVADWPVNEVYCYMGSTDGAAQFTTDSTAEASGSNPYAIWSVDAPDAVNLSILPAGFTFAAYSTAEASKTVALLGIGVTSGSMSWRKSGGSDNPAEWNRLGIMTSRSRMSTDAVLQDLDFSCTGVAKMSGNVSNEVEFTVAAPGKSLTVGDGEVLIASASSSSRWYPAPVCSPADGVVVAAEQTIATFQLKNETTAAQVITGRLFRTGILGSALKSVNAVSVEATAARGWEIWHFDGEASTNTVFTDELAAGETRTYRVRIPRTAFDLAGQNQEYGDGFNRAFSALMRFSYGSNGACTYLSLTGESSQGAVAAPWPVGLWVGTMTFDTVSQVKGAKTIDHNVAAGGRMRVRAIVHVGTNGTARLLHHVAIETTIVTNAAGESVVQNKLYAGKAKPSSSSAATIQRLDSVAMDIDHPIVEGDGAFTLGDTVKFAWQVDPKGRANPFYHSFHPEHDGLTADYEGDAPSGDDMNNYRNGPIKPETWTIRCGLQLAVTDEDRESYMQTVAGRCVWTFGNLRQTPNGEDLRTSGTFRLTRVQNVGELEL